MSYQSEFKKFESRYVREEKELIVLLSESVGSAGSFGKGMWTPSAEFLAFIDPSDNSFVHESGYLEWLCEDSESGEWRYDLQELTAYRVKCRSETEENRRGDRSRYYFLLTEVLERDVKEPELQKVLDEYLTPVEINDELCGKFVLDRQFDWFTRKIDWAGRKCSIYLECDFDDDEAAGKALDHFKRIYADLDKWDKKLRRFAAEELTGNANEWQEDSDEENTAPITEKSFAERIHISEFSINEEGEFSAYADDDDMFWGHSVEISGNVDGELDSANICG
ncbi:MAG TPA: hypothetical protein DDX91_02385 [Ruminococcaceae bacterium]|nr:hypothetical protein [Oscillospiraceae bacterium]